MHLAAQVTKANKNLYFNKIAGDAGNLPGSYRQEMDKRSLLTHNALLSTPKHGGDAKNGIRAFL